MSPPPTAVPKADITNQLTLAGQVTQASVPYGLMSPPKGHVVTLPAVGHGITEPM